MSCKLNKSVEFGKILSSVCAEQSGTAYKHHKQCISCWPPQPCPLTVPTMHILCILCAQCSCAQLASFVQVKVVNDIHVVSNCQVAKLCRCKAHAGYVFYRALSLIVNSYLFQLFFIYILKHTLQLQYSIYQSLIHSLA